MTHIPNSAALILACHLSSLAHGLILPGAGAPIPVSFTDGNEGRRLRAKVLEQANATGKRWGPGDLVVVPAVYNRWGGVAPNGTDARSGGTHFERQPFWSYENLERHRQVFVYQRLWPDLPYFVPNRGYEGAIYLRFIIDHYHDLPPVMVFLQDDYIWTGPEDCFSRQHLTYFPLALSVDARERCTARDWGCPPSGAAMYEQCWRDFARLFHLPGFAPRKMPCIGAFTLNNFAVHRNNILRRPLEQWQAAYEMAVAERCHEGHLNMDELSDEVLEFGNLTRGDEVDDVLDSKAGSGTALEYLSGMIYGFTSMDVRDGSYTGPIHDGSNSPANCAMMMPQHTCSESPCA